MVLAERILASNCELITLFVRYPHPAVPEEYRAVSEWLRLKRLEGHEIRHIEITLGLWGTDAMEIGTGEPGPRVLAGRNQVFVSHAVNIAHSIGARQVWYGACLDDAADYPDCGPAWVEAMDRLARQWGIMLQAPLLGINKDRIREEAAQLGASGWWSCYEPRDGQPCGACNSCRA